MNACKTILKIHLKGGYLELPRSTWSYRQISEAIWNLATVTVKPTNLTPWDPEALKAETLKPCKPETLTHTSTNTQS
jgi:hypothetical protein